MCYQGGASKHFLIAGAMKRLIGWTLAHVFRVTFWVRDINIFRIPCDNSPYSYPMAVRRHVISLYLHRRAVNQAVGVSPRTIRPSDNRQVFVWGTFSPIAH